MDYQNMVLHSVDGFALFHIYMYYDNMVLQSVVEDDMFLSLMSWIAITWCFILPLEMFLPLHCSQAMARGLGSRLAQPMFTTCGKLKVKVPKYNNPR